MNFDPVSLRAVQEECLERTTALAARVPGAPAPTPLAALDLRETAIDRLSDDEDVRSAMQILLYGLKGVAAYADHAAELGQRDPDVAAFLYRGLRAGTELDPESHDLNGWLGLVLECGKANLRAMELLEMVGLPDKANAYPAQLSGGQKQRIAIARALATNPKVLLCDEATSALDPNTTHSILTLIKDINRKLGITVVVITHQMSVVEEICDSVAILDGGVVVEQGSVQEIFANPKTAAAKRLVAPNGGSAARDLSCFAPDDHVVRVTFNGSSTAKPLVASLAAEKGILVSVLSADTRDLSGQCYGSMLLKLPADLDEAKQAAAYMRAQPGITVEEVTGE